MKVRALDNGHDWTFGKGLNNYKLENDAIKQNIKTRLLSWVGDCFFDENAGIDWINRLGNRDQRVILEQDIRKLILQTEDVRDIMELSVSLDDRLLSLSYEVQTVYSQSFIDNLERTI